MDEQERRGTNCPAYDAARHAPLHLGLYSTFLLESQIR